MNRKLYEAMDDSFSLEELNLLDIDERIEYCKEHTKDIVGEGSSRIVFQLDDEKVLKLAKNERGIEQNRWEHIYTKQHKKFPTLFPSIYYYDREYKWVISEFVLPAEEEDFKNCLGISWEKFIDEMSIFVEAVRYGLPQPGWTITADEFIQKLKKRWVNRFYKGGLKHKDFLIELANYFDDEELGDGWADIFNIHNWGLTIRNKKPAVVILDAGYTKATIDMYEDYWN